MISRFETVVKQEIELHKNTIADIYENLRKLRNDLNLSYNDLKKKIELNRSLVTDLVRQLGAIDQNKEEISCFDEKIKKIEAKIDENQHTYTEYRSLLADLVTKSDQMFKFGEFESVMDQKFGDTKDFISEVRDNHEIFKKQLSERIIGMNAQTEKNHLELGGLKKEIEELRKSVKESVINSEWAKKDMKKKQKMIFILEKKFEYIETRIERLHRGCHE